MRFMFLTALLASTAIVPAHAQDVSDDGSSKAAKVQARAEARNAGGDGQRDGGRGNRGVQIERAQNDGTRDNGNRGNGNTNNGNVDNANVDNGNRRVWRGQRVDPQTPPPVQTARSIPVDNRRDVRRGQNSNGNGNNGVPTPTVRRGGPATQVIGRSPQNGGQSNNDDRRWDQDRDGRVDRRWDSDGNGQVDRHWNGNGNNRADNDWNNGWRNDRRYNWQQHRNTYRNAYRAPRYYHPYGNGYQYRRFSVGFYLDSLFFGSRYWINDPWQYRLPPAYGSYRWVRYYDDVLLIDLRNGRVVDVIYDFYW
jgi:hypothetical protein